VLNNLSIQGLQLKSCSEIVVVTIGKGLVLSLDDFLLHLGELVLGDDNLGGGEEGCLNEGKVGIVDHLTEEPDERLLELVVALGGDVVVLQVLLSVESDLLGLDFTVADVDLVADEDDGDGLTDTGEILVPLGDVRVGDAGAHVEHDDTALAANIVAVTEATELLLACGVPNVEVDLTVVGVEGHGVHLDSESGDVALLEFTSQMSLDEGGLSDTTVTDEDELELGGLRLLSVNHCSKQSNRWLAN